MEWQQTKDNYLFPQPTQTYHWNHNASEKLEHKTKEKKGRENKPRWEQRQRRKGLSIILAKGLGKEHICGNPCFYHISEAPRLDQQNVVMLLNFSSKVLYTLQQ